MLIHCGETAPRDITGPFMERLLPTEADTCALGARLAALARPGDAILLAGPLGAGKTALARGFLRAAMADPALVVPSPSFTLVQTYPLPSGATAWHFDLWRLSGPEDLAELGWEEARQGIALVEWPERLGPLAPPDALHVSLAMATDSARTARLAGWTDRLP
jgi:tRNA threonylcarbamoyladenosine biosynthesis protein TsaE